MRRLTRGTIGRISRRDQSGNVRGTALLFVGFALGIVLTALCLRLPRHDTVTPTAPAALSEATKTLLARLPNPVQLRFYSLLDASASGELRQLSTNVEQLLGEYQQEAKGKLTVAVFDNASQADPNSARADGIKGFNLDKGDGCYLGIAIQAGSRKAVLNELSPEWENAVETDLSRAIERVTTSAPLVAPQVSTSQNTGIAEEIKQKIPNLESVSLEEAERMLRAESLKEYTGVVTEMQAKVREAENQVKAATSGAEQESAMKHLQEVQNLQSQKLKDIAAKSQEQIEALQKIKGVGK